MIGGLDGARSARRGGLRQASADMACQRQCGPGSTTPRSKPGVCSGRSAAIGRVADRRLSPQSVALVVKKHAGGIGLDPKAVAVHSLRRASPPKPQPMRPRSSDRTIIRTTGHTNPAGVSCSYIEDAEIFTDPPSSWSDFSDCPGGLLCPCHGNVQFPVGLVLLRQAAGEPCALGLGELHADYGPLSSLGLMHGHCRN